MGLTISTHSHNIQIFTIDRPPVNALNSETIEALAESIEAAMRTPEVRVIVITGAGKVFAAGADLEELASWDSKGARQGVSRVKEVMAMLRRGPKPVIAAINGLAAGGGLELAMACDIRIADAKASMGLPEVTLGVLPGAGGTQLIPRLIGIGNALELMMTGRLLTADEALRVGLIQKIAGESGAFNEALVVAEKIAQNAPMALTEIKASAYATLSMPLEEGLEKETEAFSKLCITEDKNEGIAAFKARRKPVFKGR